MSKLNPTELKDLPVAILLTPEVIPLVYKATGLSPAPCVLTPTAGYACALGAVKALLGVLTIESFFPSEHTLSFGCGFDDALSGREPNKEQFFYRNMNWDVYRRGSACGKTMRKYYAP